jgi:hypothetical protein
LGKKQPFLPSLSSFLSLVSATFTFKRSFRKKCSLYVAAAAAAINTKVHEGECEKEKEKKR